MFEELLAAADSEIADSDVLDEAVLDELLHSPPSRENVVRQVPIDVLLAVSLALGERDRPAVERGAVISSGFRARAGEDESQN